MTEKKTTDDMTETTLDLERLRLAQEQKRLDLLERQIAAQELMAQSQQTHMDRTAPKDNPNYVPVGLFTQPNGRAWSEALKCDIFFGRIRLNDTPVTKEEVEQLNRLQPLARGVVVKVDGSHSAFVEDDNKRIIDTVEAKHDASGRLTWLRITVPLNKDSNPQHYPSLSELARQLADQAEALVAA